MDYNSKIGIQIMNAYEVYFSDSLNNLDNHLQGTPNAGHALKALLQQLPTDNLRYYLSADQIRQVISSFEIAPVVANAWTKNLDMVAPHLDAKSSRANCMSIRGNFVADDVAMNQFLNNYAPIEDERVQAIGETFRSSLGLGFNATREEIEIAVGREFVLKTPLSKRIDAAIYNGQLEEPARG